MPTRIPNLTLEVGLTFALARLSLVFKIFDWFERLSKLVPVGHLLHNDGDRKWMLKVD